MKNNKIELRRKRDFGDVINVTFAFVKEHFTHFLSMYILISLPAALVAVIFISIFPASDLFVASNFSKNIGRNIIYILIYAIAGFSLLVFLISAVYQYMALYMKKGTNFSITDLWKAVLGEFWRISQTYIFFMLGFVLVYAVMAFVVGLMMSFLGTVGGVLGGIILFLGILASIYFFVPLSYIFVVRSFEPEKTFMEAIKRANYLVKDNWWACFGLSFVMAIIQYIMVMVLKIPFAIFGMADVAQVNFSGVFSIALIVETVTNMITAFLPTLATIFQYFALVEMKDATGLTEKVEKFGTVANSDENEDEKEDY